LIGAKVRYFDPNVSTLTLPAFTTKTKTERIVDINPDGEIYKMLVKLTEGRDADAALFTRNGKPVKDYRGEWRSRRRTLRAAAARAEPSHLP
jgi:hypothetical protein